MSDPINSINNSHMIHSSSSSTTSLHESDFLSTSLASEELRLALNKVANEEDLLKAINKCKSLILESDQCSEERKWLVRHLIELRLRLQECRDAMTDPLHPRNHPSASTRVIKGHRLNLQQLLTHTSKHCDHCTGKIWNLVQAWYECEYCEYSCHYKCLALILRECAHVIASEKGTFEYEICPEHGLSAQKYLCSECKSPLPISRDWSEARICDYSGLYFCTACHWGSSAVIPARVIHNWDMDPQPVSQAALQLLKITADKPIINVKKLNPKLFSLVPKLALVRRLRQNLLGVKKYLILCRKANEDKLLSRHVDLPYLLDNADMYSLQDLIDVHTGKLPFKLQTIVDILSTHVKVDCEICKGRGHICEICSNNEVIFPFDEECSTCNECFSVFHKHCYTRKSECPKCKRIKLREERQSDKDDIGV